jgi:hypothetical protein
MPTSNFLNPLKKLFQTSKKKNNKMMNSTTINNKKINNKIKIVKTHYIYIFMDDIEIKKLFDDYSVNTRNNIKIEKNGTEINFDIKKITRISNTENNSINNKSKKIKEIEEILRGINDNVIIYIKPLKLKSNSINKNKVDYIFLKKRENNSENKLKSGKYFFKSLIFRGKTNSENDLKNTNFRNDLKNKIKYFKSNDIFSEIVKIINKSSNNSNNKTNNESINNKENICNINNKIGYKIENKSGHNETLTNNIENNYSNTFLKMCNKKCQKDKFILVKSFRREADLKDIEGKLSSFLNKDRNLFTMLPFLISFNIYKRNSKIRFIKNGFYKYEYENENPIISIHKNNKNMYTLLYKKTNNNNEKYFELIEKTPESTITYKFNFSDILYFIMINLVYAEITIILKKCAHLS